MGKIIKFIDGKLGCWSTIKLEDGSFCSISVAQPGVRVHKGKSFFGGKFYDKSIGETAKDCMRLNPLVGNKVDVAGEAGILNPVLKLFTNFALQCESLDELKQTLNKEES